MLSDEKKQPAPRILTHAEAALLDYLKHGEAREAADDLRSALMLHFADTQSANTSHFAAWGRILQLEEHLLAIAAQAPHA